MFRVPKSAGPAVLVAALALPLTAPAPALATKALRASMTGAAEVPRGDANGRGRARITTDRARGRVCYRITLSRVGTVAAGHIHKGAAGKAGPIVVGFFATPTRRPVGCVSGVSRKLIADIERHPGRYYVNVHNKRHPAGAVRGQLRG